MPKDRIDAGSGAITDIRIDLVSDTATKPTAAMRAAMAAAAVGDEQRGEDPTVNLLCERVAALLAKETALFLPSGTMCNQIAVATHCRPGDEVIAAEASHIITSEAAGAAVLAGSFVRAIACDRGIFSGDDVISTVRARRPKLPRSRLVAVEQTNNRGGGAVWPLAAIKSVADSARAHGLALHMDGARLLNAVIASGVSAKDYAAPFDSVWLDLSKGLGCPVGGVLAGSKAFIDEAWVWKHRLGGAMRQAGILAAAGLYALDHHVERLAEDHDNARVFARSIADIPGIRLDPAEVETNLVFFDVKGTGRTGNDVAGRLRARGVRIGVEDTYRMRAATHLDVDRAGVEEAAEVLRLVGSNG
ncbi:MAG: threonine aldolase family protein [Rhodospirillales bacterium]